MLKIPYNYHLVFSINTQIHDNKKESPRLQIFEGSTLHDSNKKSL